jgi:hypothetical protein
MAVPYTFGSATASIPLSQLDSNFATTITLGNTAIQLGNTVTTLNNMTLASPTLTTPALGTPASGVMTNVTGIPAGQITGSQAIPKSTLPTGSVLQVVQATYSTATTIASTSFVDTGLSGSITPTSATSKILVLTFQASIVVINSSNSRTNYFQLIRGSTNIFEYEWEVNGAPGNNGFLVNPLAANVCYLDSPATTSSTTYKTQAKCSTTSDSLQTRWQIASKPSIMVLLEISA